MCECDIKIFKMILEDLTSEDLFKLGLARVNEIESLLKVIVPKKKQLRFKKGEEVVCTSDETGRVFKISTVNDDINSLHDYNLRQIYGGYGYINFVEDDENLELYVKPEPKFKEGDLVKVVRIEKYNKNGHEMTRNLSIGMFGILSIDLNRPMCTDFILNNKYGVMESELELVDVEKDVYVKNTIFDNRVYRIIQFNRQFNMVTATTGVNENNWSRFQFNHSILVPKPQAPHVRYFDVLPNGNLKYGQSGWVQTLDKWIEFFETSPNPSNVILPQLKELKYWRMLTEWKPKKD